MPGQLARQPLGVAEDDRRRVLLELDLALRREARAEQLRPHDARPARARSAAGSPPAPRRQTRSGAISRPFGVSSSASTTLARGDVVREHPLEVVLRVRARRRGRRRAGRRATPWTETLSTLVSLGSVPLFRSKAEAKVAEAGYDPARLPPGPVPDREVAGAARGLGAEGRPRDLEPDRLRRGRAAAHAHLGAAARAAEPRGHRRHPLRHALEPLRHDLQGRALERARQARRAEAERALRRRARRAGLHGEHAARRRSRTRTR